MLHISNYFNKHLTFLIIFTLIVCFNTSAYSYSYTKLDASGNELPDNATEWTMVRDNETDLIWEVKSSTLDGEAIYSNPHDPDNTYTWYDSNRTTNGGDSGTSGDGTDTEDFINTLNDQKFGGFDDWRMPTESELISIVKDNSTPPMIDTAYFNNTISDYYWASETCSSDDPSSAKKVSFEYGGAGCNSKSVYYYARAVRSNTNDDNIDPSKPSVIHFKQSEYEVDESVNKVTVSVVRSEGNEGKVSVKYSVKHSDSSATEGDDGDFTLKSAVLTWEDGDSTDKTFDIIIHDDKEVESDELFTLEISDPTPTDMATIGIPSTTSIKIKNNDTNTGVTDLKYVIQNIETKEEFLNIIEIMEDYNTYLDENISSEPSEDYVKEVDIVIDNIGETIKKSDELFKDDIIDVGNALKPLNLLDDVIEIGAETANSNGKIDIQNVADSISTVEVLVETTSDSPNIKGKNLRNIAGEHLKNIANRIDNIMNNMPNVTNAVKDTQDVKELLVSIGGREDKLGLAGSGIKTSLKIDINPADTIDTIGDIVKKGLEKAVDAGEITNTGNIVKKAGDIVEKSVQVLKDNDKEKKYIKSTLDQIQDELGEIVEQTTTNITNKSVKNKIFASTNEDVKRSVNNKDFKYVMDSVAGLTKTVIQEKYALKSELTGKLQELSHETMKNVLGYFTSRSQNKVGTKDKNSASNDNSEINSFIKENLQLLNELIEISSINLTDGIVVTQDYIDTVLENNLSFTKEEKTRLSSGLPTLPNFDQDIIESGRTELSLIDILNEELKTEFPGATVKANSMQGIYLNVMLKYSSDGIEFEMPLYIQDARVVSSAITEGLYLPPEGVIILVRKGIASIITPAPMDAVNTLLSVDKLAGINKLFGSDNKKVKDVEINNSGNLKITFKDGSKFSGAFSYGIKKQGDGNFDAGTSSFEPQGTDPATEAYSVLVDYNDGYTQQLQPSVSALEQLVQVLDTLAAGSYTLDRETGILTVLGMKFKPSYLIEALTPDEAKAGGWFDQNQDSYGIAWEADDYNQDGAVDLKMWTDDGKQVIYTVIN